MKRMFRFFLIFGFCISLMPHVPASMAPKKNEPGPFIYYDNLDWNEGKVCLMASFASINQVWSGATKITIEAVDKDTGIVSMHKTTDIEKVAGCAEGWDIKHNDGVFTTLTIVDDVDGRLHAKVVLWPLQGIRDAVYPKAPQPMDKLPQGFRWWPLHFLTHPPKK